MKLTMARINDYRNKNETGHVSSLMAGFGFGKCEAFPAAACDTPDAIVTMAVALIIITLTASMHRKRSHEQDNAIQSGGYRR